MPITLLPKETVTDITSVSYELVLNNHIVHMIYVNFLNFLKDEDPIVQKPICFMLEVNLLTCTNCFK